jgi:hypothetical protein
VNKNALVTAGSKLIDLGYHLSVTSGPKGNQPYLREWQNHALPTSHWEEFVAIEHTTGIGAITAGLAVIDIDGVKGLDNWRTFLAEHGFDPTPFRQQMVSTPGGGYHLYLRDPYQTVTNAGGLLGPVAKVDVRGTGGFITMPPTERPGTPGYRWITGPLPVNQLPEAPQWMSGTLRRTSTGEWALCAVGSAWEPKLTTWGEQQVTSLAMQVSDTGSGGRHQALIVSAVAVGHLIAEGKTTTEYAYASLDAAARIAGLHEEGREKEVLRTILDGFLVAFSGRLVGLETLIKDLEGER